MTARQYVIRFLGFCLCALLLWGRVCAQAAVPLPTPVAPPAPLTIEQAVALALQNNPAVTLSVQNVGIAQAQVDVARANQLPDVTANATATWTPSPASVTIPGQNGAPGTTIKTGTAFSASGQLVASQPLWPSARWQAPIAAAQANVGINRETLARTRQQIAFQTRQAFYQLLGANELLKVADVTVQASTTQLRLARSTVQAGLAPQLDVYQAEAALAQAEIARTQARNGVDLARASLAVQLGLPAGTPVDIIPTEGLPTLPPDVEALVARALRARPELASLTFRRQQLLANIRLIEIARQPVVNLQANYNQEIVGGSAFGTKGLTVSAVAALTLFNGGQTRAELAVARLQLAEVDTTASQLALGISLDVRQAWLNLQNSLEQLIAAERQRRAAAEALRIAEIRYQAGEGIVLEVDQARQRYTQALTALAQARFQAQTAAAQLDFALGAGTPETMAAPPAPTPAP